MIRYIVLLLALFWMAPAHAQALSKVCFPTAAGSAPSCQDVTTANPFPVTQSGGLSSGSYTCSATCNTTNSGVLAGPLDTNGFASLSLQVTSTAGGDSFQIQGSNDNINWVALPMSFLGTFNYTIILTSTNQLAVLGMPTSLRFIRVIATAYSSGTMAGSYSLSKIPWQSVIQANSATPYPLTAVPISGNASGTTGAVVGTLAAVSGKLTYICGFSVSAIGGTATVGPVTVANTITSSQVYQFSSLAAGNTLVVPLPPCIPANANNTAITITTTADGSATAVNVNSWGFQQ